MLQTQRAEAASKPPNNDRRRRDIAVGIIIRACQVDWGTIEFSVWDGRAIAVRPEHSLRVDADPRPLPSQDEILAEEVVQEAGRVLADLYRTPRAVFTIQVNGGRFSHFMIGPARVHLAWSDQPPPPPT